MPASPDSTHEPHRDLLGHPRGLFTLFFAELWERFSYYGMRALLTLYMVAPLASGGLHYPTERAVLIYGTYTMSVYMLSIPGGTIADNLLGARAAVLLGGSIIACGHFCLAVPSESAFFIGLVLIVLGTGLLKPNISAMVGGLYAQGDHRRDAGFSIFYMGINIGAFIAPLVTGFLAQHTAFKKVLVSWGLDPVHSWHWGFAAAGFGMLFGLAVFLLFSRHLLGVGKAPAPSPGAWKMPAITMLGTLGLWGIAALSDRPGFTWIRTLFILVPVGVMIWFGCSKDAANRKLGAIFYFFVGAFIFWALFEQAGSSLNLFADRFTQTHVWGLEFPSAWFQSANPLFVILLAPMCAVFWMKLGDKQPSSAMKFTIGLFFLTAAFALMFPAAKLAAMGRVSPLWLLGLYLLQSIGELCLSPVGLSTFTKLSPPKLVGAMLGTWFLAAAFGNKFAGVLASKFGEGDASHLDRFFGQQALAVLVVAFVFLALTPWVRRRMGDVR